MKGSHETWNCTLPFNGKLNFTLQESKNGGSLLEVPQKAIQKKKGNSMDSTRGIYSFHRRLRHLKVENLKFDSENFFLSLHNSEKGVVFFSPPSNLLPLPFTIFFFACTPLTPASGFLLFMTGTHRFSLEFSFFLFPQRSN